MICASIDSQDSIERINDFLNEVKLANPKIPIMLVGTKSDMRETNPDDCISSQELQNIARENNFRECFETSSKNFSNKNVRIAITKIINMTTLY